MLNRKINFILIVCLMTKGMLLMGQTLNMLSEGFRNSVGVSISGGVFLDKEAVFFGASTDYSRLFSERWIVNVSLSFYQEHSSSEDGSTAIVNTLAPALALGYSISPRLAAGIGVGKGMFDDDNSSGNMQYTSEGNLTVGLLSVYTLYQKGPTPLISEVESRGESSPPKQA